MNYLIDEQDLPLIQGKVWCVSTLGYIVARCKETESTVYMHRLIMGNPEGKCIDHINGNKADNRRCNLRLCDKAQNLRNMPKRIGKYTSLYKGVHFDKNRSKWKAEITFEYKNIHLGRFNSQIEAAKAYNSAALRLFGEFAKLNEI
jgi:hypothetical protein